MSRFRKRYAPLIVIAATLLAALAWAGQSLDASAGSAANAADDLAACQRLATRVTALSRSDRPVSGATELATPDVARLIESAATTAAIPPDSLIRIVPEPARTREGRPYQEQSTEVVLHAVTVEQTVRFLYALSTAAPNLRPTNLSLLAPSDAPTNTAAWNAEIRLTHRTYIPATPQKPTGFQPSGLQP
jgi:hypothetical protein